MQHSVMKVPPGKRIAPTVPKTVDVTKLLCNQLLKDGDLDGAANILEERGRLLEAADWLARSLKM